MRSDAIRVIFHIFEYMFVTYLGIFQITTLHKILIKLISITKNLEGHIFILGWSGVVNRVYIMWQPGIIRRNLCVVYREGNIDAVFHWFVLHRMNTSE